MRYTFFENKFDNKYNKYKLFEYDQFDDEEDENDDVENIDQEKIELMSYICSNIEQLFDKLFNEDNSLEDIEKYIKYNKKLLNEIYRDNTLLMIAAYVKKNYDVVKLLLENGADPNIKDMVGWTTLMYACSFSDFVLVKLLLEHKADPNIKNIIGRTALMEACRHDDFDIVKLLLEHEADPNIKSNLGNTALRYAKKKNDTEIINLLLEHGAKE